MEANGDKNEDVQKAIEIDFSYDFAPSISIVQ
jgi:hypothetical protein